MSSTEPLKAGDDDWADERKDFIQRHKKWWIAIYIRYKKATPQASSSGATELEVSAKLADLEKA